MELTSNVSVITFIRWVCFIFIVLLELSFDYFFFFKESFKLYFTYLVLAASRGMWDPSSPTRDGTCAP